jgi:LysM repeat protein
MKKSASSSARAFAAIAVIAGFVLVFVFLAAALGGGDDEGAGTTGGGGQTTQQQAPKPAKDAPATYEVKDGDTLTAIARSTGVPVGQIERLNPGVDPQILNPGEKLKLR